MSDYHMVYVEIIKQTEATIFAYQHGQGFVGIKKRSHTYCPDNRYGFALLPTGMGVNYLLPELRVLTSVADLNQRGGLDLLLPQIVFVSRYHYGDAAYAGDDL